MLSVVRIVLRTRGFATIGATAIGGLLLGMGLAIPKLFVDYSLRTSQGRKAWIERPQPLGSDRPLLATIEICRCPSRSGGAMLASTPFGILRMSAEMGRRDFVVGMALLAVVPCAAAEQSVKRRRLAIFSPSQSVADMQENGGNRYWRAAFVELRRLGHVEGENLTVERYGKEQNTAGLDALAAKVVLANPDLVLSIGPELAALRAATAAIPIVAWTSDPIALGLIHSMAHPGGNITGVSVDAGLSIWGKRIGLLSEMFPSMSRLAFLGPQASATVKSRTPAIRAAAEAARLTFITALYDLPASELAIRQAIITAVRDGADAVMVADTPETFESRVLITDLIGNARLPAMYAGREFAEVGGLMAYAVDFVELSRHSAQDIDAILRGTKPGDIPYFQPTKFNLTINLNTAKALGLTVPQILLAQADDVIE